MSLPILTGGLAALSPLGDCVPEALETPQAAASGLEDDERRICGNLEGG